MVLRSGLRIVSSLGSLLVCLLGADLVAAQDRGSISGYVRDASSGETLLLANVIIRETTIGATTNHAGFYSIGRIAPGEYTIVCSYLGYRRFESEVTVGAGQHLRLDIELQPDVVTEEEVVITADELQQEQRNVGVSQLPIRTVQEMPAVMEADVFRSLQMLPGIKAASDFSSGLYIRGGGPDQTLIMLDRTTVYNPTHFFGFFSTFNPDAIKDVRVYKGGYPAEYGGRLGSVVDVYNLDGNRREFQGRLRLGLLASSATVEGPYAWGSWMLSGRRSTLEPYLAVLRASGENVPDFYFYDLNAKLNFDISQDSRLSLSAYTGIDDVKFDTEDDLELDLEYGNRTISLDWTQIYSNRVFTNVTLTGSEYFNYPRFGFGGTTFERTNQVYEVSAKGDVEYLPSSAHQFKAGFWLGQMTLRLQDYFDGSETLHSRIQSQYASLYLQKLWRPAGQWNITGGVRGNYFAEGDYLRVEPRLSLEYFLTENIRLQGAYGRYYQFLTLITSEAFSGFDVWLTTGEGVAPSWGDQFVAGIKTNPRPGYNFDVEFYYRSMSDLFELDPRLADGVGAEYQEIFRFGDGYAYGAEVFLEKTRGRLTGFVGYTYAHSRRRFEGFNENRFYPPKYDRIHDVNVVLSYNLGRGWRASTVFSYASGQTYTQLLGSGVLIDSPVSGAPREWDIVGRMNASRLPAYHRLDVGVTREFGFFGLGNSELQLQVVNAYSRRNVWFYQYDRDQTPVERQEVRMLPIVPSITYSVNI